MNLQPFAEMESSTKVMVIVQRKTGELVVSFVISGGLDSLEIPVDTGTSARVDRLWENTCFECFIAPADRSEYWEVNFSPAADWNFYSFDEYRQGMREEASIDHLAVQFGGVGDVLTVSATIPLPSSIADSHIEVGLCAVVKEKTGNIGYWALAHPAEQPDFHDRRSFVVTL